MLCGSGRAQLAADSQGHRALQWDRRLRLIRANQILVLWVLADVPSDEGTQRNDLQIVFAGKFECGTNYLASEALSLDFTRRLGMSEGDLMRLAPVGEEGNLSADVHFKSILNFVIQYLGSVALFTHRPGGRIACWKRFLRGF